MRSKGTKKPLPPPPVPDDEPPLLNGWEEHVDGRIYQQNGETKAAVFDMQRVVIRKEDEDDEDWVTKAVESLSKKLIRRVMPGFANRKTKKQHL